MLLDRRWIGTHIPHSGSMCLLDQVLSWDATRIRCRSATHRAPDNPLRAHGRLGAACGIEYAAQAMAVHGALVAGRKTAPVAGYLAGLRRVAIYVARLDDIKSDLVISGERIDGDSTTVVYQFSVHNDAWLLLTGRATILLDATVLSAGRGADSSI